MSALKGDDLIIKIGDAGAPENFAEIGGMRATKIELSRKSIILNHRESGAWQNLQPNAGIQKLIVTGAGMFTDAASEETLRALAFSGANKNFQLLFPNGDMASGAFQVMSYVRVGDYDTEEQYALTLESAGTITYA
jgi:TP901-1 family phage major tail protein